MGCCQSSSDVTVDTRSARGVKHEVAQTAGEKPVTDAVAAHENPREPEPVKEAVTEPSTYQYYSRDSVKQRAANTLSKLRTDKHVQDVYSIKETLGTGGFSVVKLAIAKATKKRWACKIMKLPPVGVQVSDEENSREDIFKEIDLLCNVNHENVLCLNEFFVEGDKVYIITELLTGGELLDAVLKRGSYSEAEARSCFSQLLQGIDYLHSRNIVHRDLKLENLLLAKPDDISNIKIADFGLAKKMVGGGLQTVCGTPQYVAPEVIMGIKNYEYGPGVDMWSAGVVLYVLLGGYPPFWSDSEPQLFELIRRAAYSFDDPVWKNISDNAKDMIRHLLVVDPSKRLSAAVALQHPWMTSTQASFVPLMGTKDNMKRHFRPKFKAVVDAVIASNRMGNMMGNKRKSADALPASTEVSPTQLEARADLSPDTDASVQGNGTHTTAEPAIAAAAAADPLGSNDVAAPGRPPQDVTTGELLAAAAVLSTPPRSARTSDEAGPNGKGAAGRMHADQNGGAAAVKAVNADATLAGELSVKDVMLEIA